MFTLTKLAAGAAAGVFALSVTSATAFAAFQPVEGPATATTIFEEVGEGQTGPAERGPGKLAAILDRLVEDGVITDEQRDRVLEAVAKAAEKRQGHADKPVRPAVKAFLGSLIPAAVEYLETEQGALRRLLAEGKTLGQIADDTEDKSRDGLIDTLVDAVTERIDQAFAEETITEEQAERLEADLDERVTQFVDHVFAKRGMPEKAKELRERAKERVQQHKERIKESRED